MQEILENLWSEYFAEKCAVIDTDEERVLIRKIDELHEKTKKTLTQEQNSALEKYIEALYENQGMFVKKAFFKGCEFAVSFLFETKDSK